MPETRLPDSSARGEQTRATKHQKRFPRAETKQVRRSKTAAIELRKRCGKDNLFEFEYEARHRLLRRFLRRAVRSPPELPPARPGENATSRRSRVRNSELCFRSLLQPIC